MKFAKQLSLRTIPSWLEYHINYRKLKKYLNIKATFAKHDNQEDENSIVLT